MIQNLELQLSNITCSIRMFSKLVNYLQSHSQAYSDGCLAIEKIRTYRQNQDLAVQEH